MIIITDLRLRNDNILKAYVDIEYHGLIVKGLRVVNGKNGMFVSMPREKGKDDKWYDTCIPANIEVKQEIETLILNKYYEMAKVSLPPEG